MSVRQGNNIIAGLQDISGKANTNLDNVSAGIDFVVESQFPTAQNNYTWYRKYKSGWVEQGGIVTGVSTTYSTQTIPVAMADTNYTLITSTNQDFSQMQYCVSCVTSTTTFKIKYTGSVTATCCWQVSGMAA